MCEGWNNKFFNLVEHMIGAFISHITNNI
jgi:hypothetical protein